MQCYGFHLRLGCVRYCLLAGPGDDKRENRPRHAGRKLGVPVEALALPRKGTRRTLTGFPSHSRVACWGPQQPFACRGKIERTRHSSSFNYTSEQYRGPNEPAVMPVTILTID